jgi:thiol-disulfide isomerase/thioredoxin
MTVRGPALVLLAVFGLAACAERIELELDATVLEYDCDHVEPQAASPAAHAVITHWADSLQFRAFEADRIEDAGALADRWRRPAELELEVVRQACELRYPHRMTLSFPETGAAVPPLLLEVISSRDTASMYDLAHDSAHYVLVEFWSLGCPPCLARHDDMVALARSFAARGVKVGGVVPDSPDDIRSWLASHGGPQQPQVFDRGMRAMKDWQVYGIPRMFLVAPGGQLVSTCRGCGRGPFSVDSLPFYLEAVLAGDSAKGNPGE